MEGKKENETRTLCLQGESRTHDPFDSLGIVGLYDECFLTEGQ